METKEKIKQLFIVLEDFRGEIIIVGVWNGHHITWELPIPGELVLKKR